MKDMDHAHCTEDYCDMPADFGSLCPKRAFCSTCHNDGTYFYNITGRGSCLTCGITYVVDVNKTGRAPFGWHI